jgi:competence protein ComEC
MKILQFPLTKITIGFLLGILLFKTIPLHPYYLGTSVLTCLTCLLITHGSIVKTNRRKFVFGLTAFLTAILLGFSTALIHKESLRTNHYSQFIKNKDDNKTLRLSIQEKIKNTKKNTRYYCNVLKINNHYCTGKIILNLHKPNTVNFKVGTILLAKGNLSKNQAVTNPNVFDYGKYLENQEIYAQCYVDPIQIKTVGKESSLWASFSNFRNRIMANLQVSAINKDELYVLNALILGQQQEITPELLKDYQYAGAVHVLSVSGLHVGFIMLFITFLLKPIPNNRKGALLKTIVVILVLWTFAIIASLAPSIVRSVTMFSFLAIGLYLRRTVAIYHTLLVSILLILLFKPSFLFDVGFQLSYLALFFILWLQPLLAQVWKPKHKITSYAWDILTVSFAAQIGTLPLSLYYFHQFPGLFFVTNILILPLIGIIMAVGVLAILIALFCPLPFYIAKATELLIKLLNVIIHSIASQEEFVIRNIAFSKEMLWVSYLMAIFIILWLKKPTFQKLLLSLASIMVLQLICIHQKITTAYTNEYIVFNIRKNTLITEKKGNKVTAYSNDSLLNTLENNNTLQAYLVANLCEVKQRRRLQNINFFNHQKILIIDSSALYPVSSKPDIVILTRSPKLNLERFLIQYKPKQIIADGSNYKSYCKRWEATCFQQKIPFHNTNEKGFYKL